MVEYVLKLDGDYYAGQSTKYWDMFNISGRGALGATRMDKAQAEKLQKEFSMNGWKAEIEVYDPKRYLKEAVEEIIKHDASNRAGKDTGYAIRNLGFKCLEYIKQLDGGNL